MFGLSFTFAWLVSELRMCHFMYFPGECRNRSAGENDMILPLQAAKVSCQKLPGRMTRSPVTKGDAAEGSQQLDSYKKIKLQLFPINKSTRQRLEKV